MNPLPCSAATLEILPGVHRWAAYSPEHRVELSSHAVLANDGWVCFDPIPLADEAWRRLERVGPLHAIVLTNGNHERALQEWRYRGQAPTWVPPGAGLKLPDAAELQSGERLGSGWRLHALDGGGPGEMAFRYEPLDLVIVGDAIVNLEGRGLELLPDKYCADPRRLRESLRMLTNDRFERLMAAHGAAVLSGASARIRALLDSRG